MDLPSRKGTTAYIQTSANFLKMEPKALVLKEKDMLELTSMESLPFEGHGPFSHLSDYLQH